jgi:hypothetical protein
MAVATGRLIAVAAGFRLLPFVRRFIGLSGPRTGLRLAPLEVFAERGGKPGFFSGVCGIGLLIHKDPGIAGGKRFQGFACRGRTPMANPARAARFAAIFDLGSLP